MNPSTQLDFVKKTPLSRGSRGAAVVPTAAGWLGGKTIHK